MTDRLRELVLGFTDEEIETIPEGAKKDLVIFLREIYQEGAP